MSVLFTAEGELPNGTNEVLVTPMAIGDYCGLHNITAYLSYIGILQSLPYLYGKLLFSKIVCKIKTELRLD